MSETDVDTDIPRDPATGQFAESDNNDRYGLAGVEDDNNYVPLTTPSEPDEIEGDEASIRAAFDDLVAKGGVPDDDPTPDPIHWIKTDGSNEPLDQKVTTTVEQAAEALTAYQAQVGTYWRGYEERTR